MKKLFLFCAMAVALSTFSIGCSSTGSSSGSSSSWCRLGSPWSSRTQKDTQMVYTSSGIGACAEISACDPCNPCEPVCDPCAMSCTGGAVPTGVFPGPATN